MSQRDYIEVTLFCGTTFRGWGELSDTLAQACEFDTENDAGKKFTTFVTHDVKKNTLSFYQGAAGENAYDGYSWQLLVYVGGEAIAQHLADHIVEGGFYLVYRGEGWPAQVYACTTPGHVTTLIDGNIV